MLSGLATLHVAPAILEPSTWRVLTSAGSVLLVAVGWAFASRDGRRARRFLAEHPEPSAD